MADLTVLPGISASEMEKALELVKKEFDTYIEFQTYQAKIVKAKYDALIEEGFNEVQALHLCSIL